LVQAILLVCCLAEACSAQKELVAHLQVLSLSPGPNKMARFAALVGAAVLGACEAWGQDGHTIIAHVADALLDPEVNKVLLADLGKESLSDAATWCDDFDHTSAGRWSGPLHYINYPGKACSFDWSRDCKKDWCNVGALSNYTTQVWDSSLPSAARLMALNFMIHMMGDLHQPLHVGSGDDRGGNTIHVSFDFTGKSPSNWRPELHAVWDTDIIVQIIDDLSAAESPEYPKSHHNWQLLSEDILKRVKGEWASNATAWSAVVAEKRADATFRKGLSVVAGESAARSCEFAYVQPDGTRIQDGDKLTAEYYQHVKPVVTTQLAKGGVRLARLLGDSLAASRMQHQSAVILA